MFRPAAGRGYLRIKTEAKKCLGEIKGKKKIDKKWYAVEHEDDEVNYLQIDDIYASENDAMRGLVKMLQNKLQETL